MPSFKNIQFALNRHCNCIVNLNLKNCNELTVIPDWALHECREIQSIVLPDSVVSIGECAFGSCTKLECINIPKNVISIGREAFANCPNLKKIILDPNNTKFRLQNNILYALDGSYFHTLSENAEDAVYVAFKDCNSIKDHAFADCTLKHIRIPENITSISNYAFACCEGLSCFYVDDNNCHFREVDGVLFTYDKETLLKIPLCYHKSEYEIPYGVKHIIKGADNRNLKKIVIPETIEEIPEWCFSNNNGLKTVEIKGNKITKIGDFTFFGCRSLENIIIPDSVISIGENAFACCTKLTTIIIPRNTETIGKGAFSSCCNLHNVVFNSKLKEIGDYAFWDCIKLQKPKLPPSVVSVGKEAFGYDDFNF